MSDDKKSHSIELPTGALTMMMNVLDEVAVGKRHANRCGVRLKAG
ncbi:hypothetical protein [Superficieibacter sp.]|nr:hypothetical protein [Superficieibacter sp.]